jgi:hypothetical protein
VQGKQIVYVVGKETKWNQELLKPMELQGWTSFTNGLSSDEVVEGAQT